MDLFDPGIVAAVVALVLAMYVAKRYQKTDDPNREDE
jgi:hypothetical protein